MPAVLFVCMGNICRSPTAEGVFRERVRASGLGEAIHTDSAGTHDYHIGKRPDPRSHTEAQSRGVDISDLRARQVDSHDFEFFDYLLAMDEANYDWLIAEAPSALRARIHPFLRFAPDVPERWVPDPYFGGDAGFRHVFDLVEAASDGLLAELCQRYSLV
ncbi:MAG: low molecular weight phosphotyrosine protein phosphatase [Spiribacter salinus]|uniref:protein-tyrosine-phosphatase n=1 Tax=Spiribacter salinus TaxID=1335746 RepID=A0A540VU63_9GAMM|nr:MAG: low molecular weight phosphotyrosine protein phosphatase [Spiribacter salinus]